MARQSKAEKGQRRLAILKRYGVLIDAREGLPSKLPPRSKDPSSESFKSWCERVVGCDPVDVVVFAHSFVAPQTGMKRLRETSPSQEVGEMLIAQQEAAAHAASQRLERANRKAAAKLAQAATDEARVRAASSRLTKRERTSGLDKVAADLERWLDGNSELDELVLRRAQGVLEGLEAGRSVAEMITEVLLFAQQCRTQLGRSGGGQPASKESSTR